MKKIIDDRGRLFGKISVIDIFVIIIALVLIFAIYVKLNVKDATSIEVGEEKTYCITVYGIRTSATETMWEGDVLYDANGNNVGRIQNVEVVPAEYVGYSLDGKVVRSELHDRVNAVITVAAEFTESNGKYYANRNFELKVNEQTDFHTKYNSFNATTTEIGK